MSETAPSSPKTHPHNATTPSDTEPREQTKIATYFQKVQWSQWSIAGFLDYPHNDLTQSDISTLIVTYLRSLKAITSDNQRDKREQKTAQRLLNRYYISGEDARLSKSKAPVVIHGDQYNVKKIKGAVNVNKGPLNVNKGPLNSSVHSAKRKRTASPTYQADFARTWKGMDDSNKWRLSSGDCVEDVIYRKFRDHPSEHTAHSWVIDTSDKSVELCFGPEDWKEICAELPSLPEPEEWFLNSVLEYDKLATADNLLKHIHCTPLFTPDEYDRLDPDERTGKVWLNDSMYRWCKLSPSDFTKDHLENWYTCNLWETIYDQCMNTVTGSYMSRGETMSHSSSDRRNSQNREPKKRRLVGHLYDGILSLDGYEFGVAEHSRKYSSSQQSKWVQDTLKVVKALHDILYTLQSSGEAAAGLQAVGIVVAGWHCQNWRMSVAKGYMCILTGDKVRDVPSDRTQVFQFIELLTILWMFRGVLKSCKALMGPGSLTAAQKAERLINYSRPSLTLSTPTRATIPRSVKTDGSVAESSDGNTTG